MQIDFDKGWGRLQRCLLIVGIILSIYVINGAFIALTSPKQLSYIYDDFIDGIILSWVPYFLAIYIGWIVKGFRVFRGNGTKN